LEGLGIVKEEEDMEMKIAVVVSDPAMPFLVGLSEEQVLMVMFPWALSPERRRAQGELGHRHYCPDCPRSAGEEKHFSVWAKDIGGGKIEYTLACGRKGMITEKKLLSDQKSFLVHKK